jgi:argonaute-like protein implicated in RNA metabolism and viral defense
MTNKKEDLKTHYLDTHINLLSHILFGINYTFNADKNEYECQIPSKSININDKLKEINAISEKIKEKKFESNNTFKEKINKLNKIINDIKDGDEDGFKQLFTTIMT